MAGQMMEYERHHATLFVDPAVSGPIEELRRTWDPTMSEQIAAHVTLIYPWEARHPQQITEWARALAEGATSFRLCTSVVENYSTDEGVSVSFLVEDIDHGYEGLRQMLTAADFTPGEIEPHVSIVHPRTSDRGAEAWRALESLALRVEFIVREIAITAWDGQRWPTIARHPFRG